MRIEVSRHVAAPASRVWDVITDLGGSPEVLASVTRIELLEGPDPLEVGTRWRETRSMFGREATEEMTVTAVEPGRSYRVVAENHGTRYESTMAVRPQGEDDAVLSMTFSAEATSLASKVMSTTVGRLFVGSTRKALEQDLADIASAAELGPRDPGGTGQDSGGRPAGP
jgi:uncharacterized protein YndB with AHSA1/START domain